MKKSLIVVAGALGALIVLMAAFTVFLRLAA